MNDLKLKYNSEIEKLQMRVADFEAEDLRKMSRR